MKRKLLCCSIAVLTTFSAALALGNAAEPSLPNSEDVSMDVVNEYLLENGFSEEFIEATDDFTKRSIFEQNGTFESDSTVCPMPMLDLGQDWPDFVGTLTVANIPEEQTQEGYPSHKRLIFNWEWDTTVTSNDPIIVRCDAVSIYWGEDYHVLPETASFSISGTGTRIDSNIGEVSNPHPSEPMPPDTLYHLNFLSNSGEEYITQYEIALGAAYRFAIPENLTKKMYYGRYWGEYKIDLRQYNGTYSIEIIQVFDTPTNKYNSAIGNYYRWEEKRTIDYSFEFSLDNIAVNIDPKYEAKLAKSTDKIATFRFF